MVQASVFSDFLRELGVPHTVDYSDRRFAGMPFRSLFGFSKLLGDYGVRSEGLRIADKGEFRSLVPPFLAQTPGGFVIVTRRSGDTVDYLTDGVAESMNLDDFTRAWTGIVFLAFPDDKSAEPDYRRHRFVELAGIVKKWLLVAVAAFLFVYFFISSGLYGHVSTVLLTLLYIVGTVLSVMLMQKSLNIGSRAADRVCTVLEKGGCDSILKRPVSKFFGIFSWSEVGLTYFGVSLATLLLFPEYIGYLALLNLCCLPYTVWSIWYQRFRAKEWCTLCVSVQCTLWLLFFCYLGGGWFSHVMPIRFGFIVLGAVYLLVLLVLNRLAPAFDRNEHNDVDNETDK